MLTHAATLAEAMPSGVSEGFVVCELGSICIAIAQADVVTIEHGAELSAPLPAEQVAGWFNGANGPWPVYRLDGELNALCSQQPSGAYVVFIKGSPWPAGVLCDSVRLARARSELAVQTLPPVMQDPASSIAGVARIDKARLAWVLRARQLATQLNDSISRDAQ